MLRIALTELLLFLLPFVAFAAWLLLRRRNPAAREHWRGQELNLVLAGLFVAILGLVIVAATTERRDAPYEPPHLENGRLVPGQFGAAPAR